MTKKYEHVELSLTLRIQIYFVCQIHTFSQKCILFFSRTATDRYDESSITNKIYNYIYFLNLFRNVNLFLERSFKAGTFE